MVDDVTMALKWVLEHSVDLGGDPSNITVMGQSAGAHIGILAMITAAEQEAAGGIEPAPWCSRSFARFVGISGPYDIVSLLPDMHRRGLHKRLLRALMVDPIKYSPMSRLCVPLPRESVVEARCFPWKILLLRAFHDLGGVGSVTDDDD